MNFVDKHKLYLYNSCFYFIFLNVFHVEVAVDVEGKRGRAHRSELIIFQFPISSSNICKIDKIQIPNIRYMFCLVSKTSQSCEQRVFSVNYK